MKIAINTCFGGFSISDKAIELAKSYGADFDTYSGYERNNPILIRIIEELGEEANGRHSELKIVEIPDDVQWEIAEYDGSEHIAEQHRTWY